LAENPTLSALTKYSFYIFFVLVPWVLSRRLIRLWRRIPPSPLKDVLLILFSFSNPIPWVLSRRLTGQPEADPPLAENPTLSALIKYSFYIFFCSGTAGSQPEADRSA